MMLNAVVYLEIQKILYTNLPLLTVLYRGSWSNCVLKYSNKYTHNWKTGILLQLCPT